jgi:hypothetical protein
VTVTYLALYLLKRHNVLSTHLIARDHGPYSKVTPEASRQHHTRAPRIRQSRCLHHSVDLATNVRLPPSSPLLRANLILCRSSLTNATNLPLLRLPAELRNQIYSPVNESGVLPTLYACSDRLPYARLPFPPHTRNLQRVCRQLFLETTDLPYYFTYQTFLRYINNCNEGRVQFTANHWTLEHNTPA